MDFEREIFDPRRSGQVTRYHTWPRLREQNVADHSWNVARILIAIWPECPRTMIYHALFHDIGEVAAGDPPYPSKKLNPALGTEHKKVEEAAYLRMVAPWGVPPPAYPDTAQHAAFKLAEFIEMMEWAHDEVEMGNRKAWPVLKRCSEAYEGFITNAEGLLPEAVVNRAKSYMARRRQVQDVGGY